MIEKAGVLIWMTPLKATFDQDNHNFMCVLSCYIFQKFGKVWQLVIFEAQRIVKLMKNNGSLYITNPLQSEGIGTYLLLGDASQQRMASSL
jgi:hypothetical protein